MPEGAGFIISAREFVARGLPRPCSVADYRRQHRLFHIVFFLGFMVLSPYTLVPALDFVAGFGLFQEGPEAMEQWLNERYARRPDRLRYECRDGEQGWDYICTRFHTPSASGSKTLKPSQVRVGIRNRLYSFGEMELPNDGPIPSREFLIAQIEARSRAVKEGIDLNMARVDQLMIIPGVNEALARRIVSAANDKPFERVEDLLQIEGISQHQLKTIREYVRVGPRAPEPSATPATNRPSRSG